MRRLLALACLLTTAVTARAETLNGHVLELDPAGGVLPWTSYRRVVDLGWRFLDEGVPIEANGLPTYYAYCQFERSTLRGQHWPHNPASFYAGLTDGALRKLAFDGDRRPTELVRALLDYTLAHGTTPAGQAWSRVPYSSGEPGAVDYDGADFGEGRGDGKGGLEPDKVGELGLAYLRFFQFTGDVRYREAALFSGAALAAHVRDGDAVRSPWPFRVDAATGAVREEYTANVIGALRLLDELIRLGLGDVAGMTIAKARVLAWFLAYPMVNGAYSGYFEDVPAQTDAHANLNQYIPLEAARYFLDRDDDPAGIDRARSLIAWTLDHFAIDSVATDGASEAGRQWQAEVLSEQRADMDKMGSHTARYAAITARLGERTRDEGLTARAWRSFNWASYMCDADGIVTVGPHANGWWFSDGYGDYLRHFSYGMGANPGWAPAGEDHLLRSSSVVTEVRYLADELSYRTSDAVGDEVLRLHARPTQVFAGTRVLTEGDGPDQFRVEPLGSDYALRLRRSDAGVRVLFRPVPAGCHLMGRGARDAAPMVLLVALGLRLALALALARRRMDKRRRTG